MGPLTFILGHPSFHNHLSWSLFGEIIKEQAGREVEIILCPWFEHFWLAFVWVLKECDLNGSTCLMRRHCCHVTCPMSVHQPHLPHPAFICSNTVLFCPVRASASLK